MFLCLQVLSDPRQKRFFKAKDMADLFTLGDEYAPQTETADMFASLNGEVTAPEDLEAGQTARTQVGPAILKLLTSMKQQGIIGRALSPAAHTFAVLGDIAVLGDSSANEGGICALKP